MSLNSYQTGVLPTADSRALRRCLEAAGYTHPRIGNDLDGTVHLTVDQTVDPAAMKAAVEANYPPLGPLTLSVASPLVIAGDGVATALVTITDPRGARASGNTIKLRVPPGVFIPTSVDSFVLDAAGQVVVTFGPLSGCYGNRDVEFYDPDGVVDPVLFVLRFGSA